MINSGLGFIGPGRAMVVVTAAGLAANLHAQGASLTATVRDVSGHIARFSLVRGFPPDGYGLQGQLGNVWERCADWHAVNQHRTLAADALHQNPAGPGRSFDPRETHAQRGTDSDTGRSLIGFRCVLSPDQQKSVSTEKIP